MKSQSEKKIVNDTMMPSYCEKSNFIMNQIFKMQIHTEHVNLYYELYLIFK